MKNGLIIIALLCANLALGQNDVVGRFNRADSLMRAEVYGDAYQILKKIERECPKEDTLYDYILWNYISATSALEYQDRMKENFEPSLSYGLEALDLIRLGTNRFGEEFGSREFWMRKNIIISYFGLGQFENAKPHRDFLYTAYKENRLPKGIEGYFNFDYFKLKDRNVWGYEWYPELPEDRFASSFTKIVYYVYSTNPDGTDREQLFRFHVLMFHQLEKNPSFDYILERQIETDKSIISGSYYKYTYKVDMDYKKLRSDIIAIVSGDIEPDTRRTIMKQN